MTIKFDVDGTPFLFERFDMGAWMEIFDPDTRETEPFNTIHVFVPGYFTGDTHMGSPILDPNRLSDPPADLTPVGYRPPVEIEGDTQ